MTDNAEPIGGDIARFVELVVGERGDPPTTVVVERDGIRVTFPASASAELIVEVAVGLATRAR